VDNINRSLATLTSVITGLGLYPISAHVTAVYLRMVQIKIKSHLFVSVACIARLHGHAHGYVVVVARQKWCSRIGRNQVT